MNKTRLIELIDPYRIFRVYKNGETGLVIHDVQDYSISVKYESTEERENYIKQFIADCREKGIILVVYDSYREAMEQR